MSKQESKKLTSQFKAVFEPNDYFYFYEKILTDQITNRQIKFLVKKLKLGKSKEILDIPCGFGRHANRLAELGHKVTGVDITPGFLEIAKKDAKKKRVGVNYIHADMRNITFKNEFDRIIMLFTSFGYFTDEENLKILKNISGTLKIGGLLCFDIFNRDAFLKTFLPYIVSEKGKDMMIDLNSFDSVTGRLNCRRIVIRNGKRKDKPFSLRLYNPTEIKDLLNKAGLVIHKIYQDWDGNPFTSDSRRMIVIAKKQKPFSTTINSVTGEI